MRLHIAPAAPILRAQKSVHPHGVIFGPWQFVQQAFAERTALAPKVLHRLVDRSARPSAQLAIDLQGRWWDRGELVRRKIHRLLGHRGVTPSFRSLVGYRFPLTAHRGGDHILLVVQLGRLEAFMYDLKGLFGGGVVEDEVHGWGGFLVLSNEVLPIR